MGPTNIALVKLFKAETRLRESQRRLSAVTRNVRLQQAKADDFAARRDRTHADLTKTKARIAEIELEIKSRDEKIESMRTAQQTAQTNREYQAFLIQINTQKVDRTKLEEELLKLMEQGEGLQGEYTQFVAQADAEAAKLKQMHGDIDERVKMLSQEVEAARPERDEAATAVSARARELFDRLADKFDGEAMAPIEKPHPKREEYICSVCNLDLTLDVYNKLHTRDEPVMCPSGNHLLYIPDDLPPEKAVHKPKEKKAPRPKKSDLAAPVRRQTLASSVVSSVDGDEDDTPTSPKKVKSPKVPAGVEQIDAPAPSEPTGAAVAIPPQTPPLDEQADQPSTATSNSGG